MNNEQAEKIQKVLGISGDKNKSSNQKGNHNQYSNSEKKESSKGTGYSGKLSSQGTVDAGVNGAPKVDAGKQGKHVRGHGNNAFQPSHNGLKVKMVYS